MPFALKHDETIVSLVDRTKSPNSRSANKLAALHTPSHLPATRTIQNMEEDFIVADSSKPHYEFPGLGSLNYSTSSLYQARATCSPRRKQDQVNALHSPVRLRNKVSSSSLKSPHFYITLDTILDKDRIPGPLIDLDEISNADIHGRSKQPSRSPITESARKLLYDATKIRSPVKYTSTLRSFSPRDVIYDGQVGDELSCQSILEDVMEQGGIHATNNSNDYETLNENAFTDPTASTTQSIDPTISPPVFSIHEALTPDESYQSSFVVRTEEEPEYGTHDAYYTNNERSVTKYGLKPHYSSGNTTQDPLLSSMDTKDLLVSMSDDVTQSFHSKSLSEQAPHTEGGQANEILPTEAGLEQCSCRSREAGQENFVTKFSAIGHQGGTTLSHYSRGDRPHSIRPEAHKVALVSTNELKSCIIISPAKPQKTTRYEKLQKWFKKHFFSS